MSGNNMKCPHCGEYHHTVEHDSCAGQDGGSDNSWADYFDLSIRVSADAFEDFISKCEEASQPNQELKDALKHTRKWEYDMAKTPAERKADQRDREAKEGIIQVNVKIHESNKDRLDAYVRKLLKPKQGES